MKSTDQRIIRPCRISDEHEFGESAALFTGRVEGQEECEGRAIPAGALDLADTEFAVMAVHDLLANP